MMIPVNPNHNIFKVYGEVMQPLEKLQLKSYFEFSFENYNDFRKDERVSKIINRHLKFHKLSIRVNTRSWVTEHGRKTMTFYTCMLEMDEGRQWCQLGRFEKDIKELPRWSPPIEVYQEVTNEHKQ